MNLKRGWDLKMFWYFNLSRVCKRVTKVSWIVSRSIVFTVKGRVSYTSPFMFFFAFVCLKHESLEFISEWNTFSKLNEKSFNERKIQRKIQWNLLKKVERNAESIEILFCKKIKFYSLSTRDSKILLFTVSLRNSLLNFNDANKTVREESSDFIQIARS